MDIRFALLKLAESGGIHWRGIYSPPGCEEERSNSVKLGTQSVIRSSFPAWTRSVQRSLRQDLLS